MARGVCTFKERDVKAAVKAVVAAGVDVKYVKIDKCGSIILGVSKTFDGSEESEGNSEWDHI